MKKAMFISLVLVISGFLSGCYNGFGHIEAGIKDIAMRNSTVDVCISLLEVAPRISHGKYYYDRCFFQGPEGNVLKAYCPKDSLKSRKMVIGQSYRVHANFWGKYGSVIDPNEGVFFDPDGEVISCQK